MTAGTVLCAGVNCQLWSDAGWGRHRVPNGLRVCLGCRDKLASGLRSLAELYSECGRLLDASAGRSTQFQEKTSGGPMPGVPFNTLAADTRTAILDVLNSWSGMLAEEHHITPPERSVGTLVEFLCRHVDWIAGHPAAVEATKEVARLVRSAWQIVDPAQVRRVPIGTCVEAGCGGQLRAIISLEVSSVPAQIYCDTNSRHNWSENQWRDLSTRMASPLTGKSITRATHWFSASEIARVWRIPSGSVYRLASEQEWRRHKHAARTYYHEDDVYETLNRRQ